VKRQKEHNDSWLLIGFVLAVTFSATLLLWQNTYRDNLLIAGVAGSLLLTLLVWSLAAGRSVANARFRGAFEHTAVGMALMDMQGRWLQVNKALCQMSGYSEPELLSKNHQEMTHPEDLRLDTEFTRKLYNGEIDHYHMEKRYFRKDREVINTLISVSLVRDLQEKPVHYVLHVQDITERKRLEQRVQHQANHDELTGLPNRHLLHDRLLQAINQCRRYQRFMAVMFIDVDNFKGINDALGHDSGDEVLRQTANRLQHCIRETDTLARQGGDEFVAVLTEITSPQDVGTVATAIAQAMLVPVSTGVGEQIVTLSIGIAVFDPVSNDTAQILLKNADTSLYEVKRAGRNAYRIYA